MEPKWVQGQDRGRTGTENKRGTVGSLIISPHFPSQLLLHLHHRVRFWRTNGKGLGTGAPRMIENKRTHRGYLSYAGWILRPDTLLFPPQLAEGQQPPLSRDLTEHFLQNLTGPGAKTYWRFPTKQPAYCEMQPKGTTHRFLANRA